MLLEEMSWDEAVGKCAGKVVLVPHGSTEEHGYHLPLNTDAVIAEHVCRAFAKSKDVVVAPTMTYTALRSTKAFPGSVGSDEPEYRQMLEAVVTDFLKLKPRLVAFFLAHDGKTQRRVFDEIKTGFGKVLRVIHVEDLNRKLGMSGHAGEGETSLMLCFAPSTVKMDRAVDDKWPEGGVSRSGVNGIPTRASKQKGKRLFDSYVKEVGKVLEEG